MDTPPLSAVWAALRQASPVVVDVPAELRHLLLRRYIELSQRNGRIGLLSWVLSVVGLASDASWWVQSLAVGVFAGLIALREWRVGRWLNQLDPQDPHSDRWHDGAVLLATGLWGWAPLLCLLIPIPLPDASLLGLAFGSILALSAMAVGYLPALPATLLALVCGMAPVVVFFVLRGDLVSLMLALATVFYTASLAQRLRLNHATLLQALLTERENARLVERLQRYQDRLESENVQLNESLRDASLEARRDGLTGLFNRRHLAAVAESVESGVREGHEAVSICVIDIDHFKHVNDSHGHAVGDEVLRSVAHRLVNRLRDRDCLVRYGGEEFVALLRHCNLKRAITVAQSLRTGIAAEPLSTSAGRLALSVSIGVAQWVVSEDFDETFQRADRALYQAKEAGRNAVVAEQSDRGGFATTYIDSAVP